MHSHYYRLTGVLLVLLCCWLVTGISSQLRAQMMNSVVNSTEDDDDAHPWDNPDTPDIDESMDGICGDFKGRCTLRAALDEAAYMGLPAHVTFSVNGKITNDPRLATFMPPSGSVIDASDKAVVISGRPGPPDTFLMQLQDNTTVRGLDFTSATDAIVYWPQFQVSSFYA